MGDQVSRRGMIWLFPLPLPLPVSKLDRRHTWRLRKRDNLLPGEGAGGWVRSQIIRQRESLVLYESFNTRFDCPRLPYAYHSLSKNCIFYLFLMFCKFTRLKNYNFGRLGDVKDCGVTNHSVSRWIGKSKPQGCHCHLVGTVYFNIV